MFPSGGFTIGAAERHFNVTRLPKSAGSSTLPRPGVAFLQRLPVHRTMRHPYG